MYVEISTKGETDMEFLSVLKTCPLFDGVVEGDLVSMLGCL